MAVHNLQALVPHTRAALDAAQLAREQRVEPFQLVHGPADAGAAHRRREALLVDADGVFDEHKVDVRDLEYVEGEVAFEDAGSGLRLVNPPPAP